MRLLPVRADHAGGIPTLQKSQPDQGRSGGAHGRQSLPLHDLFAHPEGDHACGLRNAHRVHRQRSESNMNGHVKITQDTALGEAADLSRRSFLVGTAAAGLALGYSAVPGMVGADQAFAAAGNFDPSVWYSIAPDGIVTVTCGKADM